MLDVFIKVIDRLIQLLEIRKRHNRQIFEDHIAPIYKDLQLIIDDYRKIILDMEQQLKNPEISPDEVVEELIIRRREHARSRDEVQKYSTALSAVKPSEDIYQFALACRNLLTIEPPTIESRTPIVVGTPMTTLIGELTLLLRILQQHKNTERLRKDCSMLINNYSQVLDECWDKVASNYFNLRTKYLQ